jgi:hypothetical protein
MLVFMLRTPVRCHDAAANTPPRETTLHLGRQTHMLAAPAGKQPAGRIHNIDKKCHSEMHGRPHTCRGFSRVSKSKPKSRRACDSCYVPGKRESVPHATQKLAVKACQYVNFYIVCTPTCDMQHAGALWHRTRPEHVRTFIEIIRAVRSPNRNEPAIEPRAKAAFERALNTESHMISLEEHAQSSLHYQTLCGN